VPFRSSARPQKESLGGSGFHDAALPGFPFRLIRFSILFFTTVECISRVGCRQEFGGWAAGFSKEEQRPPPSEPFLRLSPRIGTQVSCLRLSVNAVSVSSTDRTFSATTREGNDNALPQASPRYLGDQHTSFRINRPAPIAAAPTQPTEINEPPKPAEEDDNIVQQG